MEAFHRREQRAHKAAALSSMYASSYMAAMVFSNTYDANGILKTPEAITRNDLVCPGSRGIGGTHCKTARAA
jgi:hypothetical protein